MRENKKRTSSLLFCMGLFLLLGAGIFRLPAAQAAERVNVPLDKENPVYFYGDTIEYSGKTIALDDYNIYIDGSLDDETCDKYQHVYNDFKEAYNAGAMKSGTSEKPMNVWLAPYVYWIDDPDDPAIREGVNGDPVPYGLWMNCAYLSLNGLTDKPENVVLAVNRGQSHGAKGNFTMFYINGDGTHTENLTFGNYCCMDLNYPLKPELNREKRTTTITQSQLCLTNGRKITAENCNFVSRLNSCPFVGGERILFTDCHFECTDDSLPTSAVYLHCDFDLYSSRPFYNTTGTGSVMMDCDFHIMHGANQYLTKFDGVVTIIDSTFYSTKKDQYIGWVPNPGKTLRCYAGNITVQYDYEEEGEQKQEIRNNYKMDADQPYVNVDITDSAAMKAYRLTYNNETVYNVYNLLKGSDDYDPLGQKELLGLAGVADGVDYTDVPVMLSGNYTSPSVVNGNTIKVSTSWRGFSSSTKKERKLTWEMEDVLEDTISLKDNGDGTCSITCKNTTHKVVRGMVYIKEESGLEAGVYVTAAPNTQPAPEFVSGPNLKLPENGVMALEYQLPDSELLEDLSNISWYRCSDAEGKNRILTAVTENNTPLKSYTLSYGDVGYYISAVITPKQECTYAGTAVTLVSSRVIDKEDVTASPYTLSTDFSDFAFDGQSRVIPGFWIRDAKGFENRLAWTYSEGEVGYGTEGLTGLMPIEFTAVEDGKSKTIRRSRLMYVPAAGTYGDMTVSWVVNPEKNAGQGFGSAGQYMDLFIKTDAETMTGYALRVERVAATGKGVQIAFVKYEGWDKVEYISDKILTSAFNSTCTIQLAVKGTTLSAELSTTHVQSSDQEKENLIHNPKLETTISANEYGGIGIYYTGSCPKGNRVMFNQLDVTWDESGANLEEPKAVDLGTSSTDDKNQDDQNQDDQNQDDKNQDDKNQDDKNKDDKNQDDKNQDVQKPQDGSEPAVTVPKKGTVFSAGNIKYKITKEASGGKGTVSVAGVKKKSLKSLKIKKVVSYQGAKYTITSISAKAFSGCKKLKKITITSKNIKSVGKKALKGINKKCVIKVPASKYKKYKKLLKGKGQPKTVKIRK